MENEKESKSIIIYHSADFDGFASGGLLSYAFPDAELLPLNYGYDIPWDRIEGKNVYMADFSFQPVEDMKKLVEISNTLTWIDHHDSTIQAIYKAYPEMKDLEGIRDKKFAGCELTWKHLFPNRLMPFWLILLGRFDVWDQSDMEFWDNRIEPFQLGMNSYIGDPLKNPIFMRELISDGTIEGKRVDQIIDQGVIIRKYRDLQDKIALKASTFGKWDGHSTIALNGSGKGSQPFGNILNEYDMGIVYKYSGKINEWVFSVYSTKMDISELARSMGGGGHPGASGFQVKDLNKMKKIIGMG